MEFLKLKENATKPTKAYASAGYDLYSCNTEDVVVMPNESLIFPLGFALWIEQVNVCAMILPRSGLGAKKGIVLGNLVGLIDSDYQGEWQVSVWNRSKEPIVITPKMKMCQVVFMPCLSIDKDLHDVSVFTNSTARGVGGFGSSDKIKGTDNANGYEVGGTHYNTDTYQCWDFVCDYLGNIDGLTFNVFKYLSRFDRKNGKEDLEKARHYIIKIKEMVKSNNLCIGDSTEHRKLCKERYFNQITNPEKIKVLKLFINGDLNETIKEIERIILQNY